MNFRTLRCVCISLALLATPGLSGDKEVRLKYSDYEPSNDFIAEVKYYFEVSGAKNAIIVMQQQLTNSFKDKLKAEYPNNGEIIDSIMNAAIELSVPLDTIINNLMPVYRRYYSIEDFHELNKIYSSKTMQKFAERMPKIIAESAPIQVQMIQDMMKRLAKRVETITAGLKDQLQNNTEDTLLVK